MSVSAAGRTIRRIIDVVLEGRLLLLPRVDQHSDWSDDLPTVPQEPHDANRERGPELRSPRCDPKGPVRSRSCPRRTCHRTPAAEAALFDSCEKGYHSLTCRPARSRDAGAQTAGVRLPSRRSRPRRSCAGEGRSERGRHFRRLADEEIRGGCPWRPLVMSTRHR